MIIKYFVSILFIVILYFLTRSYPSFAKILSGIFSSCLVGFLILFVANIGLRYIGISVPINVASIVITGFLGIPGAAALIALCYIFR